MEHQFLRRHWGYLQDRGALVYLIPFASLGKAVSFFYRRSTKLTVFSFPDKEFQKFHQVVVMCAKGRPNKDEIRRNIATLEFAANLDPYEVPDRLPATGTLDTNYHVPEADDTNGFYFRSARLDPQKALEQVRESPVWPRVIKRMLPPTGHTHLRPLMPLREGHLAMFLASGMMNGEFVGWIRKSQIPPSLYR